MFTELRKAKQRTCVNYPHLGGYHNGLATFRLHNLADLFDVSLKFIFKIKFRMLKRSLVKKVGNSQFPGVSPFWCWLFAVKHTLD